MPGLRKCVVWSVLFGFVSYVVYHQLQEITVTFTETAIVPAKRREVSEHFLERPQAMCDFHPYGIGVSNVQRTMSKEDPLQIRELRYILHEKIPSPFGETTIYNNNVDLRLEFAEPDARVKLSAGSVGGLGLTKFRMNGTFLLADYKSKKESGTVVIDSRSFTGPRVMANQWFLAMGPPTLRKILNNVREFFVKKQQE